MTSEMSDEAMRRRIRQAAEASLAAWPAASAVLLYGSRARGDHDPLSDWDIAVVTSAPEDCPPDLPILDLWPEHVHPVFVSPQDIHKHRNHLGRLGCALARDARIIAGRWSRPANLDAPTMDVSMYDAMVLTSFARFQAALSRLANSCLEENAVNARVQANNFASCSADSAEHFAKALLVRNGHELRSTHDLAKLVAHVRSKDPVLAAKIEGLNGHTRRDHIVHYGDAPNVDVPGIRHALQRMSITVQLLIEELPHFHERMKVSYLDIANTTHWLQQTVSPPLDDPQSEAGEVAMALREGRGSILSVSNAFLDAWSEIAPEVETRMTVSLQERWRTNRMQSEQDG